MLPPSLLPYKWLYISLQVFHFFYIPFIFTQYFAKIYFHNRWCLYHETPIIDSLLLIALIKASIRWLFNRHGCWSLYPLASFFGLNICFRWWNGRYIYHAHDRRVHLCMFASHRRQSTMIDLWGQEAMKSFHTDPCKKSTKVRACFASFKMNQVWVQPLPFAS